MRPLDLQYKINGGGDAMPVAALRHIRRGNVGLILAL
jgi:hypothetical protein